MTYLGRVGVALSQLGNALRGGDPDESLSSWLGKQRERGSRMACVFCRFLDLFERDHCTRAIERDEGR